MRDFNKKEQELFSKMFELPTIDVVWLNKRRQAQFYFHEHQLNDSVDVVLQKLKWINASAPTRISNLNIVAENLIRIENLDEKVKRGGNEVVEEIVKAFASPEKQHVTWAQFQNALHFLALHQPEKYVEIDEHVKAFLLNLFGDDELKGCLSQISFSKIKDVYDFLKEVYDKIKTIKNNPRQSYSNIFEKSHDLAISIMVVITDPTILEKGAQVFFDAIRVFLVSSGVAIDPVTHIMIEILWEIFMSLMKNALHKHIKKVNKKYKDKLNKLRS